MRDYRRRKQEQESESPSARDLLREALEQRQDVFGTPISREDVAARLELSRGRLDVLLAQLEAEGEVELPDEEHVLYLRAKIGQPRGLG